jgi:hypothetical protein
LDQQKRAAIFQNAFTKSLKCFLDNAELLYFLSHLFACTPHVYIENNSKTVNILGTFHPFTGHESP